jgi:hypothetical protein
MEGKIKAVRRNTKRDVIYIRLEPELKLDVMGRSQILGKSISEYLRDLVKEDLSNSK